MKHIAQRALDPDRPVLRGSAQNPDVFFQAREACNPFYDAVPAIVQTKMDQFATLTGRTYRLFEYEGAPDARARNCHDGLGRRCRQPKQSQSLTERGEKVGLLKVRLFRPFAVDAFLAGIAAYGAAHRRARSHERARLQLANRCIKM